MVTDLAIYEKVEKTGGALFSNVTRPSVLNVPYLAQKIYIIFIASVMFYDAAAIMLLTVTREVFASNECTTQATNG